MATKLTYDLTYDAPLADVAQMLVTPAFREQVCDALGAKRRTVTVTGSGTDHDVVIDQVWPADRIPSFAKKFVGDEINLVQSEHWSGSSGTVGVEIPGKPGSMSGTTALSEAGGVTTEHVEMTIKVSIPLVGGRIESLISDLLEKALRTENATGRSWLA